MGLYNDELGRGGEIPNIEMNKQIAIVNMAQGNQISLQGGRNFLMSVFGYTSK